MIFFKPKPPFVTWLKGYARDRRVIDVGCGEGYLLQKMWDAKIKAIGVEPLVAFFMHPSRVHMLSGVLGMNAQECRVLREWGDALVLFCRPCHSGFVGETIPLVHRSSEILYVSLEYNLTSDLRGFDFTEVEAPGLTDGVRVWRVLR